jgi:hypothetical protein
LERGLIKVVVKINQTKFNKQISQKIIMTLENILEISQEEWEPALFNREIGVEEFETLTNTKTRRYRPIKESYADFFDQLDPEPARQYLAQKGVSDFRQVTSKGAFFVTSYGFGPLTGLWKGAQSNSEVRRKLVESKIMSGDLTDNPEKEDIFERLTLSYNSVKDYFEEDVVGKKIVEINQALYSQSEAYKAYCETHKISPRKVVESMAVRRHLKRFTGKGFAYHLPKKKKSKKQGLPKDYLKDQWERFKKRNQ